MKESKHKYDELKIVSMYERGMNTVQLAKYFKTYNTTIRRILIRHNVKLISTGDRMRFVKKNPFNDTRESDYYLGLLIADGCVSGNTVTLGLKESDVYMLESYAKFCSPILPVNNYFHKEHNKLQYEVAFRNSDICRYLQTKANFINKTEKCEMFIPLNWDIMRGLSDGDGSFFKYNNARNLGWDFANGSKEFCLQVQSFLKSYGIETTLTYNHCWHLRTCKNSYQIGQFLYFDSNLFLKRKRDIWADCMVTYKKINTLNSGNPIERQS
ncbi:MAG TPA: LAGLIDADG family homing endonuclease [Tissierellaceae bacterium]|nr:LAGLIDADG family homing endonuclease [Tissierellaceae bacterium]